MKQVTTDVESNPPKPMLEQTYLAAFKIYVASVRRENNYLNQDQDMVTDNTMDYWKFRCQKSEKTLTRLLFRSEEFIRRTETFYNVATESNLKVEEEFDIKKSDRESPQTGKSKKRHSLSSRSKANTLGLTRWTSQRSLKTDEEAPSLERDYGSEDSGSQDSSPCPSSPAMSGSLSVMKENASSSSSNPVFSSSRRLTKSSTQKIRSRDSTDLSMLLRQQKLHPIAGAVNNGSYQQQPMLLEEDESEHPPFSVPPLSLYIPEDYPGESYKYPSVIRKVPVPGFTIENEEPMFDEKSFKFNITKDLYKLYFFKQKHFNWIGKNPDTENLEGDYFIVSVLERPSEGSYQSLINSKSGFREFFVPEESVVLESRKKLMASIMKYLGTIFPSVQFQFLGDATAYNDIAGIERKFSLMPSKLRISVLYCGKGQTNPHHMLANRNHPESYDAFLRVLGVPVKNYRVHDNKDSKWRGLDVTWYPGPWLTEEEQRQYIGNTMACVYFYDGDHHTPFCPTEIQQMGSIVVIHIVVTPVMRTEAGMTMKYRVGFLYKDSLGFFGPCLPQGFLFDSISLKDYLLTKVFNGYIAAMNRPPLDRMFQVPRASTIRQVALRYWHRTSRSKSQSVPNRK